jgi:hypothetical protein
MIPRGYAGTGSCATVALAVPQVACAIDSKGSSGAGLDGARVSLVAVPDSGRDVERDPLRRAAQVVVEYNQMCARKTDGAVWCSPSTVDVGSSATPAQVPLAGTAVDMTVNTEGAAILMSDGPELCAEKTDKTL